MQERKAAIVLACAAERGSLSPSCGESEHSRLISASPPAPWTSKQRWASGLREAGGRNYAGCWHRTTSGHATEASTSRGSKEPKDTPHTRVGLVLSHHAIRIPCAGGQDRSPNICLCVCRTHGKPVAALDCLEGQARGPHPRREWPPGTCLQSSTTRVTHHRSPCTDRPPRGGPTEPLSSDVPRPPLSVPRACVARVPSPCQQKVTQGEPAAGMAWGVRLAAGQPGSRSRVVRTPGQSLRQTPPQEET